MPAAPQPVPYESIDSVLLDAGNTLLSMDLGLLAAELERTGLSADPGALRRAEAASRPAVSRYAVGGSTETRDTFAFYLEQILSRVLPGDDRAGLCAELAARLRVPGKADRLWHEALPGVREALIVLRDLGLGRIVVSNSDGSVERSLVTAGLRDLVSEVFDSALVGFEKPDPRIFQHAITTAGIAPERALYFGDLYHVDVLGARSAGLHAALIDPCGDWDGVDCDRFRSLEELARRLARDRCPPAIL